MEEPNFRPSHGSTPSLVERLGATLASVPCRIIWPAPGLILLFSFSFEIPGSFCKRRAVYFTRRHEGAKARRKGNRKKQLLSVGGALF